MYWQSGFLKYQLTVIHNIVYVLKVVAFLVTALVNHFVTNGVGTIGVNLQGSLTITNTAYHSYLQNKLNKFLEML